MKRAFILLVVPFLIFAPLKKSNENIKSYSYNFYSDKKLQVGEELTYVVSYSFLKLGEIKIIVRNQKIENGKNYYNAIAYIDSYSGIPFVNLHQVYETTMNSDYYSVFFRGLVKDKEYTTYTDYNFDYNHSIIHITKGKIYPPELWTDSTTSARKQYQDGLSILYYSRMNSGENKSENLPCFVKEKKENTLIHFYSPVTEISIDAVDYPIACTHLEGEMKFISIFGLTGYFEGWFSNDDAAIPLVANMKVIVGNIRVELKSWKRPGWTPPKFIKS
ncbi:MAG: DUF3108 domain-containing protein [Ignavibacteriaceae bacterium]